MADARPLRLYFIRHGQTENHHNPPFNGWRDAPLTAHGQKQLDRTAEALAAIPFKAVYSSDLSRAVYGGEALAGLSGVPLIKDPQWREMHFGRWEGLTYKEIEAEDRDLIRRLFSHEGEELPFPGGESTGAFTRRVAGALKNLQAAFPDGGRVALVCHGGVCKMLWSLMLGIPPGLGWKAVRQDFAALNVADYYPSGFCVAHLVNGYAGPEGYWKAGEGFERLLGNDVFGAG